MSKYTTEVRYICENAAGYDESKGFSSVDSIIGKAIPSIFSFDFPIFDEEYRNVLCSKILRHYYTREIGFETVGLWKLKLETKLMEIMPYYNQLYMSELIKFNPLYNTDMQTTHVGDKNEERNTEGSKTGFNSGVGSRTESGNYNKTGDNVEQENKAGENNSDNVAENFENTKNNVENSSSESGENNKTDVENGKINKGIFNTKYDLYSDTPQGALTGVDNEEYLTNARKVTDNGGENETNERTNVTKDEYSKEGSSSSEANQETTGLGKSNTKNEYNEETKRTNVSGERGQNSVDISDNRSSNSLESTSGKDKLNSTESYVLHVVGKNQFGGSYSALLKEFRETFLNIDVDIINELEDLFLKLW